LALALELHEDRIVMNIKAIVTTLVLGSSSLALAAPTVRDHRVDAPAYQPTYQPTYQATNEAQFRPAPRPMIRPVVLANNARVQGRDVIRVNHTRAFTKLELRSQSGRTQLDKVLITFGNGQSQVIDCNTTLNGSESFSIDLAGNARNIKKIVLVGKSGRRAAIDVIAV
jgi:hypothetical protein